MPWPVSWLHCLDRSPRVNVERLSLCLVVRPDKSVGIMAARRATASHMTRCRSWKGRIVLTWLRKHEDLGIGGSDSGLSPTRLLHPSFSTLQCICLLTTKHTHDLICTRQTCASFTQDKESGPTTAKAKTLEELAKRFDLQLAPPGVWFNEIRLAPF